MTNKHERQMDRSAHSGPYYIGIDIGGTNMKIGIVSKDGESLSLTSIPTEAKRGPKDSLNRLFTSVERSLETSGLTLDNIKAIGLATPGTMDIPAGMLLNPPNLPGWINVPIRQIVEDHFGKPTVLQNDATAAAYGEYWVGAARNATSLGLLDIRNWHWLRNYCERHDHSRGTFTWLGMWTYYYSDGWRKTTERNRTLRHIGSLHRSQVACTKMP